MRSGIRKTVSALAAGALLFVGPVFFVCNDLVFAEDSKRLAPLFAHLKQRMVAIEASPFFRDPVVRNDLKYLARAFEKHHRFSGDRELFREIYGHDGKPATNDDGVYSSIAPELSQRIMAGSEYQRMVARLREFRPGPSPLSTDPESEESASREPRLEFVYILAAVPKHPVEKYLCYLVDLDYLPVDADGDGDYSDDDDYEGNPIGNIGAPWTDEMHLGFGGKAVLEQSFFRDDWGDVVVSFYIPILDRDGSVLAVAGFDYNVRRAVESGAFHETWL